MLILQGVGERFKDYPPELRQRWTPLGKGVGAGKVAGNHGPLKVHAGIRSAGK